MTNVLQLFSGRGKLRERITKSFQDKSIIANAFRAFLFEASPELKDITERLSVHAEELNDKICGVMQGEIYTWTEEQVKAKLSDVVSEYNYLDALNASMRNSYRSQEYAVQDLRNAFSCMRVAILAIEPLNMPWYKALTILRAASQRKVSHMTCEERKADISELREHGTAAWECVKDTKPILSKILENKQIDCTEEELNTIYNGLKDVSCDATLAQFEKELNVQVSRIGQARNRMILIERWRTLSGTETVKAWSNAHGIPLLWVIPKDSAKAISTLISVQNNERTLDQDVVNAINVLDSMDHSILTDDKKAEEMFMKAIGDEYHDIYLEKKNEILTDLKLKLGNDVSAWIASDIVNVQKTLKRYKTEKAKKEKLQNTQNSVKIMNDAVLRDKVTSFLNAHPEFCDEFN